MTGVRPARRTPQRVAQDFRALIDGGARLLPAGEARRDPQLLLSRRYLPRHAVELFDVTYFLTDFRYEEGLNFFVAYVGLPARRGEPIAKLYPRIFYKDA